MAKIVTKNRIIIAKNIIDMRTTSGDRKITIRYGHHDDYEFCINFPSKERRDEVWKDLQESALTQYWSETEIDARDAE